MALPLTPAPTGDIGIQAATPTSGLDLGQQDAWAQLEQTLGQYGFSGNDLTNLTNWAKTQIIAGNSSAQVALELQQTPEFQARFPAIAQLGAQGVAITPAEYIANEKAYAQLEQAAGLPQDFASYDKLIASQVSPSEYSDRINKGYLAVQTANPEVAAAMQNYFGVSPGQLAAYFLDPQNQAPKLLQQAQAAEFGGQAQLAGIGLSQGTATEMARAGVGSGQAQSAFANVDQMAGLFQTDVGDTRQITSDEGVRAATLADAQAQDAIQQKLASRAAGAKGKVGVEENPEKGFEGLGTGF